MRLEHDPPGQNFIRLDPEGRVLSREKVLYCFLLDGALDLPRELNSARNLKFSAMLDFTCYLNLARY